MNLFIGTSGWAYKEWKPDFYPDGIPQRRFLEHYSSALTACEVNATFYRLQSPATFAKWSAATPQEFRFTTKAHRGLTHSKTISPDDRRSFFDAYLRSVGQLGSRLGAVLFQFPPHRRRDDGALAALLAALPDSMRPAFEFRHDSWVDDGVRETIASGGGTVCISNTAGDVPPALPPGPLAYVRLRTERYSPEARAGWLELLQREGESRDVFVFAKHEGIPTGDPYGGVGLAQWLVGRSRSPLTPPGQVTEVDAEI